MNHIKNLQKDFKAQFKDFLNMEIPKWIISPFDVEVKIKNLNIFLEKTLLKL